MPTFTERLDNACAVNQSLVCVGLDPDPTLMAVEDVFTFNKGIVDATHDLVGVYKPNLGFYEALGIVGLRALEETIQYIRRIAPSAIILGDAKRGDVGNTAAIYAKALFDTWGFDAVTVNIYGGRDTVQPFLDYKDRGVFVWCRSSNAGAKEFQDLLVSPSSKEQPQPFYELVATHAVSWNDNSNVGLVVGATYPEELKRIRYLCPDIPILLPGIGSQKGDLEQAVRYGTNHKGRGAVIASSRGILYASVGKDYIEAARQSAYHLRNSINDILQLENCGW